MNLLDFVVALIRGLSHRLEFLREVTDSLDRPRRVRLEAHVVSYCAEGYGDEDCDLAAFQAFDPDNE